MDKKTKLKILIAVLVLFVLVVGATYAYFTMGITNTGNTSVVRVEAEKVGLVTLSSPVKDIHLNLKASDMILKENATNYYAATGENPYETEQEAGTHTIAQLQVTEGANETKYQCTADVTIKLNIEEGSMGVALQQGDMFIHLLGEDTNTFPNDSEIDLSTLKDTNGIKKYEKIKFNLTGNSTSLIKAYVYLVNKTTGQNYLAGKTLNIDITTDNLKCVIYTDETIPVINSVTKTDDESDKISIEVDATDDKGIDKYYYSIDSKPYEESTESTHTYEGLEPGSSHTIKVYVTDKQGNESEVNEQQFSTKKPQTLQTLQSQKDSGLSEDLVGGMYRYQGTTVNNYICLKEVGSAGCSDKDSNMYRIIGITEEGNIKAIKQTSIGNYAWDMNHQNYSSSMNGYCGTDGCPEWPKSEVYKTLNTTFYNSLNADIQNKIESQNWWYGDMHNDFVGTLSADEVYQVETGAKETKYYGHSSNNKAEVTGTRWTKMEEKANIGLIYVSDYYYQANQVSCHSTKNNNYVECINQGWMHISKNEEPPSEDNEQQEWTMTRLGRYDQYESNFHSWGVSSRGNLFSDHLGIMFAVRPVFYLQSSIELGGEGTTENPFYIVK